MSNGQEMTFDWDRGMFVSLDREAIRQSDHVIRNNQQNADTLHRIQQNDASLQVLQVGCDIEMNETPIGDGKFTVPCITGDSSEYSTLGAAVATNEHIKKLTSCSTLRLSETLEVMMFEQQHMHSVE